MADPAATASAAATLVDGLVDKPATLGETRLLAIDGRAGSGKSTLALAVVDRLHDVGLVAALLRMDDLYDGWTGLEPALERRVLDQVLRPLAGGRVARWQRYDWATNAFGAWHDMAPPEVLVLEGCGSGSWAYSSYLTLLVWVETDPHTRRQRAVARDGPGVLDHLAAWTELETRHFGANDTQRRADAAIFT